MDKILVKKKGCFLPAAGSATATKAAATKTTAEAAAAETAPSKASAGRAPVATTPHIAEDDHVPEVEPFFTPSTPASAAPTVPAG